MPHCYPCVAIVLVFSLAPAPGLATTIHVPGDQPTLQAGIDAAAAGDSLLVACGTYTWSGEGTGDISTGMIRMKSGVVIRSDTGLPGCVTLDAEGQGRVVWCDRVDGASIEGFTIRGGIGHSEAGGLRITESSPLVMDCLFTDNQADFDGGAVRCRNSPARFLRCTFRNNTALVGGGAECSRSPARFEECVFENNAAQSGAAMLVQDAEATVTDCIFRGNAATFGGGIYVSYDTPAVIAGCTFCGNAASDGGNAIYLDEQASATVIRTIVAFGAAGSAIACSGSLDIALSCSDIYGNPGGDWVGCIGDQSGASGNMAVDPLFCDAGLGDLTLDGNSPCLPGHHPEGADCGLIGALGRGCGPTATQPVTWGILKGQFQR